MAIDKRAVRINFRLSRDLKQTIEAAATEVGQSMSDFAVSTLVQAARKILHDQYQTRLSERERKHLLSLLDRESSEPNEALKKAAKQ